MMNLKIYIVNAFADHKFGGNPAAVVPLQRWLSENLMQQIAAQNNLAETAFIVPQDNDYFIRWFTPTVEVALCGHATLASAHVFFEHLGYDKEEIRFHSKSGFLTVRRDSEKITLDFPVDKPVPAETNEIIEEGLKVKPLEVYTSAFDYLVVLNEQAEIENLSPDFSILKKLPSRGIIVTATGSAHTVMVPYWSDKLGRTKLSAIQLSKRRGYLDCELKKDRVLISGHAFTYLVGEIEI